MKYLVFILSAFSFYLVQGQAESNPKVDSLKLVVNTAKNDTTRVNAMMEWDRLIFFHEPKTDSVLNFRIDSICSFYLSRELPLKEEKFYLKAKAFALNGKGIVLKDHGKLDEAINNYREVIKIADKINDQQSLATALNNIGIVYQQSADYLNALNYFQQSLQIRTKLDDKFGMAGSYNNIGIIYDEQGNYAQAIEYYTKSLKITEQIGSNEGQQASLSNIGTVYQTMGDYDRAMAYYEKSLEIAKKLNYLSDMASSYSNIGIIYNDKKDYQKAISYYRKSLELEKQADDFWGQAITISNIGSAYAKLNLLDSAKYYLNTSLDMHYQVNDFQGIAIIKNNLGEIYMEEGDFFRAEKLLKEALALSEKHNTKEELLLASKNLYLLYKKTNKPQQALEMYELYTENKDSLQSYKNQQEILRQEFNYHYEKKVAEDSIKSLEAKKVQKALLSAEKEKNEKNKIKLAQTQLENKNQRLQNYFLFGFLGLALLFSVIIFNRFRLTKKQNSIIEKQKEEAEIQRNTISRQKEIVDQAYGQLEEKNTEILDSINYAQRIQNAILPPNDLIKVQFPDSFIFYEPKDIVAGDFYWMEPLDEGTLIAAADCTGHGVPGAMVSVVCNNALNRSVWEHHLSQPNLILDKARELVVSEFKKSKEEVKDGMDIALCYLKGNKLFYSGANNPLWVVRAETENLEEYKAHKQPIGNYAYPSPFPLNEIELKKGDSFYLFSDGFADQFGGPKNKKFKAAKLKSLILSVQNYSMEEQKTHIQKAFYDWKGSTEQLDDVCLIGIRYGNS